MSFALAHKLSLCNPLLLEYMATVDRAWCFLSATKCNPISCMPLLHLGSKLIAAHVSSPVFFSRNHFLSTGFSIATAAVIC